MIDSETKLKIVELRAKDYSIVRIAKELGLAKQTVVDTVKEMKDEIASLQAVQLDALYEAEALSVEARIKRLSALLAKLQAELDERNLSDVPTEKLVDLILKTSSTLESSLVSPIFKSSQELQEEKEARKALDSLV
jgi:transposase-like protein